MYVFVTVFVSHSRLLDSLSLSLRGTRTDWLLAVAGCLDVRMPQCCAGGMMLNCICQSNALSISFAKWEGWTGYDRLTLLYKTNYCTYRGYGKTLLYSFYMICCYRFNILFCRGLLVDVCSWWIAGLTFSSACLCYSWRCVLSAWLLIF